MSGGKKKVDRGTYDISSMKRATEEVSGSLVIRPTDFFLGRFRCSLPSETLHDFYFVRVDYRLSLYIDIAYQVFTHEFTCQNFYQARGGETRLLIVPGVWPKARPSKKQRLRNLFPKIFPQAEHMKSKFLLEQLRRLSLNGKFCAKTKRNEYVWTPLSTLLSFLPLLPESVPTVFRTLTCWPNFLASSRLPFIFRYGAPRAGTLR